MDTTSVNSIVEVDTEGCDDLEGCIGHVENPETHHVAHVMAIPVFLNGQGFYSEHGHRVTVRYVVNVPGHQRSVSLADHEPLRKMMVCRVAIVTIPESGTGLLQWPATSHVVAVEIRGAWMPTLNTEMDHWSLPRVVF